MGHPFTHKKKGVNTKQINKVGERSKRKKKEFLSSNSLNTPVPSLIMTMKQQSLGKFTTLFESLKNSTPRKGDNYIK